MKHQKTADIKHQISVQDMSIFRYHILKIEYQMSDIRYQVSEIKYYTSNIKFQCLISRIHSNIQIFTLIHRANSFIINLTGVQSNKLIHTLPLDIQQRHVD